MRDYFSLQWKLLLRTLKESGFPPLIAFPLGIMAFVVLSILLFHRTEYAPYVYLFVSLSLMFPLSEQRRNEFLRINFNEITCRKIRIIENTLVAFPFLVFLLSQQYFLWALVLGLVTIMLVFFNVRTGMHMVIPTPFGRNPFEFTVGFRNTFFVFPLAYILVGIAIAVHNFNLGMFAMAVIFLVTYTYYAKPENEYYIWIFKRTPQQFLLEKMQTGFLYTSILVLPSLILNTIAFSDHLVYILLVLAAGYLYLICMIVAKYSSFPYEIGIPQGILIAVSVIFPPLLLLIIPVFFRQSVNRIKSLLT